MDNEIDILTQYIFSAIIIDHKVITMADMKINMYINVILSIRIDGIRCEYVDESCVMTSKIVKTKAKIAAIDCARALKR